MSIELILFCSLLLLAAICLGLGLLCLYNYIQIRALRDALALIDARTSRAAELEREVALQAAERVRGLRLIRPAVLEAEIRALLDEGKILEAVRRYHSETGVSLSAAHDAVRDIARSEISGG